MKLPAITFLTLTLAFALLPLLAFAADDKPTKPITVITPGKVIIPIEEMRRPWGELISLDLATRCPRI
jgi:hypothetical protein